MSEGFVKKRGSTWTWYLSTTDPATGKRKQLSKGGFRTKKEALDARSEARGLIKAGSWRQPERITVADFLRGHWLPSLDRRPTTLASYRDVCEGWIIPRIGRLALLQVTPAQVSQMLDDIKTTGRRGKPVSASTVRYCLVVFRMALAHAVDQGFLLRNPAATVKRQAPRPDMSAWSADEAAAFLDFVADDRLYCCWLLLIQRGFRRGEILGLQWPDVDLDGGRISVTRTRVLVHGAPQPSQPKTGAGRRTVPVSAPLVAALRAHQRRQKAERLHAGPAWQDGTYVFTNELGAPIGPRTLWAMFGRHVKAAGLRPIRLHDLRHTCASIALQAGEKTEVVSKWLGHSSVSITQETYQHVIPSMLEDAGERLDAIVFSRRRHPSGQ